MTLQQWLEDSWIRQITRSKQEVANLTRVAEREIADAILHGMSADNVFVHAYNAVRTLCQVALHASGFAVPKGGDQHLRVIESLKFTLGDQWADEAVYYDHCRRTRHKLMYDNTDIVQQRDAENLLASAKKLQNAIKQWLSDKHPDMV